MLTKNDIQQLKEILATKEDIEEVKKTQKTNSKALRSIKKTVDMMGRIFDKADMGLEKRVKVLEKHAGISSSN